MKASEELVRRLPDLDLLLEYLPEDPQETIERAFPPEETGVEAAAAELLAKGIDGESLEELVAAPETGELDRERLVSAGTRAVHRLRDEGLDADLDPEEMIGLEAIVQIEGRPAILVQDGHFFTPPIRWQLLEQMREPIEKNCKSVGRIEVQGHPSLDWVGTGFLVADDVIMTNRHVVKEFCQLGDDKHWVFIPGVTSKIDYVEELGALDPAEFSLTEVIGVHETFDMALLRVKPISLTGAVPPEPLQVSATPPSNRIGHEVYCVGYPAWDGRRNDPEIMRRIFANIFNVKRLQPGLITAVFDDEQVFMHDCSTLGGNSGSCVIDMETNQVVGLHFGGRYRTGNYAVSLWELRGDPFLQAAQVNFV